MRFLLLFFITADCPIANSYAPEIQRICADYASKNVSCTLVYVDPQLSEEAIAGHRREFGYKDIPAVRDGGHERSNKTGATITPEAVVIGPGEKVLYRGRIDNRYIALGKSRPAATVHDLREALDAIVAGKPVTRPRTQAVGCYIPN